MNTSANEFGSVIKMVTFGESHGPYIGVVLDNVQPGLPIDTAFIQHELNRRKPGQSSVTTPRNEADSAIIVSGVMDGKTTGTPLCILIQNQDQRSKDYGNIAQLFRPGHATYTYLTKYGMFDFRGGGRASGRETACRVAAGAIAKLFLKERGIEIIAHTTQVGDVRAETVDYSVIEKNIVRSADMPAAERMIALIEEVKLHGDSVGGVVEIVVKNCPPGLGEPIYHKLDADFASALMSLGAIKGFEIGNGFSSVSKRGSINNDAYYADEQGRIRTRTNHAGGIVAGISNGEDIVMRIAVKPVSSINIEQETVNEYGESHIFKTEGRHDPCICPRVVPVAEAMVALVLMDHILLQERRASAEGTRAERLATIDRQIALLQMYRAQITGERQE
jgi:chorismate synthase